MHWPNHRIGPLVHELDDVVPELLIFIEPLNFDL